MVFLQASKSVELYGMHAVVANVLSTRKDRVYLVTPKGQGSEEGSEGGSVGGCGVRPLLRPEGSPFIEELLVAELVKMHSDFRVSKDAQAVESGTQG